MKAAGVPVPEGKVVSRRGGRQRPPAAAALRHQADRRGLQRRRLHRHRAARPSAAGADPRGLGLRRAGAGRALHPRQGADLRRHGRQGPGRHRDRGGDQVLRLRGEIRPGRLQTPPAGANFTICLPRGPKTSAQGASRPRLPGRDPCRLSLRRPSVGTEGLVCLEVNTQPGMTETSLVPELAAYAGMTFDELVRWMVEDASLNR